MSTPRRRNVGESATAGAPEASSSATPSPAPAMVSLPSLMIRQSPLAAIAAFAATLCDANHVSTETLSYTSPAYFKQAIWVFPFFFAAFLVMGLVYWTFVPILAKVFPAAKTTRAGTLLPFIEAFVAFIMAYLLSGFANRSPSLLAFIFYGLFAIRFVFTYDRLVMLVISILLCLGGMLVEGTLSHHGLMYYREPEVINVPVWLGGLYMHGAFALREGMRFFVYLAGPVNK